MDTIQVAVIGCGYWGPNLIRNFAANLATNMYMCCDLRQERLDYIKRTYPTIKTELQGWRLQLT